MYNKYNPRLAPMRKKYHRKAKCAIQKTSFSCPPYLSGEPLFRLINTHNNIREKNNYINNTTFLLKSLEAIIFFTIFAPRTNERINNT